MFRRHPITYLPLLLSGLPSFATDWLRVSGIPAVPYQSSALCRQGEQIAGRILIFDARDASGRLDSRIVRESGAEIINVADLLPRAGKTKGMNFPQIHRASFFDELKARVESVGGIWLRLADYPFPFRSALVRCREPQNDLESFCRHAAIPGGDAGADSHDALLSRIKEWHAGGLPAFVEASVPAEAVAEEFPLMWQTTGREFRKWCRVRSQIALQSTKQGTTYRIESAGHVAGIRPTVELWLGSHVASLPLSAEPMTVREEGVLFVQEHRRHPAGLAADWPLPSNPTENLDTPRAQQTA